MYRKVLIMQEDLPVIVTLLCIYSIIIIDALMCKQHLNVAGYDGGNLTYLIYC